MLVALVCALAIAPSPTSDFDSMWTVGPFPSGGRTPCPTDPVAYQMVEGTFQPPKDGDSIVVAGGAARPWHKAAPDKDGWFTGRELNGGYAYAEVDSDRDKVMILDASGHSMVYVNGAPRGGDVYGFGFVKLPVQLKKGRNEFLFSVSRGRVRAKLVEPQGSVTVSPDDPTFPDAIVGEDRPLWCSVLVTNATDKTVKGTVVGTIDGSAGEPSTFSITPLTVKKVSFRTGKPVVKAKGNVTVHVSLSPGGLPTSERDFDIEAKNPNETQKRTFVSRIDGSVQYYGVQPASAPGAKALVLSLHGAGVEAIGQAASYGAKSWCNIVCPTNGRPYGFDWEDWGRINAIETLEAARTVFHPDADRIYLTGHSMGGHGTWSVGFNHPNTFAAIAPCAGWISFWSYAGGADWTDPDPVEKLLRRSMNSSDTLKLLDNAKSFGIYIQHGAVDDNVPVEQAREMRKRLAEFHHDFDWHEEPGQSHWFDTDPEAGANVQDYAPLFDFLSKHRLQSEADKRMWDVTVVNPDGDSSAANVTLVAQEHSLEPSRIEVRTYADGSYEEIKTTNVKVLALDRLLGHDRFKTKIDGSDLEVDASPAGDPWRSVVFVKGSSGWQRTTNRDAWKSLQYEGGIKACFDNKPVLVYGTHGSAQEREWAYNKARFDAESWWYRGNGSLDLESDEYSPPVTGYPAPIVFYGNTKTNTAIKSWMAFHPSPNLPFQGDGPALAIGTRSLTGDLGVMWSGALWGVVRCGVIGGTTLKGCRVTDRLLLFTSGVHFPDVFVIRPEMYLKGSKGVVATGFYGPDWGVESGDFAFRE